ncbi:hypothetical protein C6495_05710 [Candidatus Poribacteria bacterium]|nr:MAG: hypothetical protein C6495_05710 [Candidatus Poribacteria bacterium]
MAAAATAAPPQAPPLAMVAAAPAAPPAIAFDVETQAQGEQAVTKGDMPPAALHTNPSVNWDIPIGHAM